MLKRMDDSEGEPRGFSRRTFLVTGAAAGGGLLLGVYLPRSIRAMAQVADETLAPNAFVRIKPDDSITLVMPQVEMGQGTYTSMSMLIAEELEVALEQIGVEAAPPNDKLYANPLLGFQVTGGSTSVPGFWEPLRRAGATARVMLIEAAASQWGVDAASCRAEKGDVVSPTGERLKYGALVEAASKLPVPDKVGLKAPEEFTLIGTPAKRIDTPEKVNGKAKFGIDAMVPGMKFATVAACPVLRRQSQERGRQQDPGNRGRAASGAHRQRRRSGGRQHVGGDAGASGALHRVGRRSECQRHDREHRRSRWRGPRRTMALSPAPMGTLRRPFLPRRRKSKPSTRCHSSPMPPWSR